MDERALQRKFLELHDIAKRLVLTDPDGATYYESACLFCGHDLCGVGAHKPECDWFRFCILTEEIELALEEGWQPFGSTGPLTWLA